MSASLSSPAARLRHAGQQLREHLRQLEVSSQQPAQPLAIGRLTAVLDEYEAAVLAIVPPAPAWQANPNPTAAELLAEREATPVYRLGFVRGYKAGQAAGQLRTEPVLNLYAQHAALPGPTDPTALMQQVRRFLTQLQQRHGARSLTYSAQPPRLSA